MNGASKQQGAPVLARTMGWREAAVSHGQRSFARDAPPASNPHSGLCLLRTLPADRSTDLQTGATSDALNDHKEAGKREG